MLLALNEFHTDFLVADLLVDLGSLLLTKCTQIHTEAQHTHTHRYTHARTHAHTHTRTHAHTHTGEMQSSRIIALAVVQERKNTDKTRVRTWRSFARLALACCVLTWMSYSACFSL